MSRLWYWLWVKCLEPARQMPMESWFLGLACAPGVSMGRPVSIRPECRIK